MKADYIQTLSSYEKYTHMISIIETNQWMLQILFIVRIIRNMYSCVTYVGVLISPQPDLIPDVVERNR